MGKLQKVDRDNTLVQYLVIKLIGGGFFELPFYKTTEGFVVACRDIYGALGEPSQTFADNFYSRKFGNSALAFQIGGNGRTMFCSLKDAFLYSCDRNRELRQTIIERHGNAVVSQAKGDILQVIADFFGSSKEQASALVLQANIPAKQNVLENLSTIEGLDAFLKYEEENRLKTIDLVNKAKQALLERDNERRQRLQIYDDCCGEPCSTVNEIIKELDIPYNEELRTIGAYRKASSNYLSNSFKSSCFALLRKYGYLHRGTEQTTIKGGKYFEYKNIDSEQNQTLCFKPGMRREATKILEGCLVRYLNHEDE